MYDAVDRRFMAIDPIRDGLNWYAYCGNNPVIFIDNTGLSDERVGGGLNVLIVVGVSGGDGRNFEIAAETCETKHLNAGDNVTIIYAQDILDNINDGTYANGSGMLNVALQII
jgi:hypothetical protein